MTLAMQDICPSVFLAVTEILWLMFNASSSSIFVKMLKPNFLLSDFQFEASVKLEASPGRPGNPDSHLPGTVNTFCSAQYKQPSQKILIYGIAQASCYFKPRAFQAAPCVPGQCSCLRTSLLSPASRLCNVRNGIMAFPGLCVVLHLHLPLFYFIFLK